MNVGLQLYTVRDHLERDFKGTLEKVANMGFHGLEFAGYGGLSAAQVKQLCESFQIKPISAHIALTLLEESTKELDYATELGLTYIVCPWLPPEHRQSLDDYIQVADTLNRIGEQCEKRGLVFAYHNHAFEFEVKNDEGQFGLDVLFAHTDPSLVKVELDIYWVQRAGLSIDNYIDRYAGRLPLLHLKDMAESESKEDKPLGEGRLNIPAIIAHAKQAGTEWFFVEQDLPKGDSLQDAAKSMQYLLSLT